MPIWNTLLKNIEQERIKKLPTVKLQYSNEATLGEMAEDLKELFFEMATKMLESRISHEQKFKLWVLPEGTDTATLCNTLKNGCKANPSFEYKLFLEGHFHSNN